MAGRDLLTTDLSQASGWYAVLPEAPPAKRLRGEQTADRVVAGAGVTAIGASSSGASNDET